jgi:hypothetical protein
MGDEGIRCFYTPFPFRLLGNQNLIFLLKGTIVCTQLLNLKLQRFECLY